MTVISQPTQAIAFLGPPGTFAETAAILLQSRLQPINPSKGAGETSASIALIHYPTIAAALYAVKAAEVRWAVVPVENSVEGGVSMTLDTLWQIDGLHIQEALVLPIRHTLISYAHSFDLIHTVYSHPQALGQCQDWLFRNLPQAIQEPTRSTTEALPQIHTDPGTAVIASERAAQLYTLPILACPINDHPENSTRFWVIGTEPSQQGAYTSLAFSMPENIPGALVKALLIFAERHLNMSRIESRPTKKSAGTYVFFIDLEHPDHPNLDPEVLRSLEAMTEQLKILGSYHLYSALRSEE